MRESVQSRQGIGKKVWVIAEGYIPPDTDEKGPDFISHETACILNTGESEARIRITVYFTDREPVGPYQVSVAPRRTLHLRLNELSDPLPIPRGTDYATVLESDVPVVIQHTRMDTRRASNALITTMAYGTNEAA